MWSIRTTTPSSRFAIGSDGKLYPQSTVNTPGIFPLAVAVNGSNLFVVDTYQPLPTCSSAEPVLGVGGRFSHPARLGQRLQRDAQAGWARRSANRSLNYWPLTLPSSPNDVLVPTAINVLHSGAELFVTAYDSSVTPNVGYIFGFSVASSGALTPRAA